jgi:hypothetical protein
MPLVSGTFSYTDDHPFLKLIRSFGFLDIENGPWVAGGSVRRILTKQKMAADIDIFMKHGSYNVDKIHHTLMGRGDCEEVAKTNRPFCEYRLTRYDHTTHLFNDKKLKPKFSTVQVIENRKFNSVEELLNDFDYTICMVATDGWSWVADDRFLRDIETKEIVLNNKDQRRKNMSRLAKYCRYGFTPVPGVFADVSGIFDATFAESFSNGFMKVEDANY